MSKGFITTVAIIIGASLLIGAMVSWVYIDGNDFQGGAPLATSQRSVIPFADDKYYVGTTTPSNLRYIGNFTDITISGTCTGAGCGGGVFGELGDVATSSDATGDVYYLNSSGQIVNLGVGSAGTVLKVSGGLPAWGTDLQGSGGAGLWATTTDNLAQYPSNTSRVVVVGGNATTTTGNIFEVIGNSLFDDIITTNATTTGVFQADGEFRFQSVTKTQTLTATSQILATTTVLNIDSASDIVMTGLPLIATSTNGAILIVRNVGDFIIDLEDNSVAGSGLYHGGTSCIVNPGDEVMMMFQSDASGSGNSGWIILSHPNLAAEGDATILNVRNVSGSTITAGSPVYSTGFNVGQNRATVGLADADGTDTTPAIGVTLGSILNNANGQIVTAGELQNIDTSAFSVGDNLYLSTTAGAFVVGKPATDEVQKIAEVLRSHASKGIILIQGAGRTNEVPNNATTTTFFSTTASSTSLSVGTLFNFLGTAITNVSTWFNGLFDTQFTAKDTDDLTEGATNLYNQTHTGEVTGATSLTIADSIAVSSWNLTTPTLTTFFGTPCTGQNFLQDIGDTGVFTCGAATGGGGGTGNVGTSTIPTIGQMPYWTTSGANLELLGSVATSSVSEGTGISFTGTAGALVGGSALTITSTLGIDIVVGELASADFGDWTCSGGSCTLDTGTVDSTAILDNTIQTVDLEATNAEADNDIVTVDTGTGGFTFNTLAELGIQAQDAVLDDLSALGVIADNEFIVGTGVGTYANESGATARTSLGVDVAGTDNSTDVTLTGTPNYLTIDGSQVITRLKLDISDDTNATGGVGIVITTNDFTLDLNELGIETAIVAGDFIAMVDITDSGSQKITFANFEGDLSLANLIGDSDNITEGATNFYATQARWDTFWAASTTLQSVTSIPNLATVGTIGNGVWEGTTVAVLQGGTGATTLDDILGTANEITITNGADTIIGGDVTISIPNALYGGTSFEVGRDADNNFNFTVDNQLTIDINAVSSVLATGSLWAFNNTTADIDFSIDGDVVTDLFFLNAGTDRVGIASTSPMSIFGVAGTTTVHTLNLDMPNHVGTSTSFIYSGTAGFGGEIIFEDTDGLGCTSQAFLNGVQILKTVTCPALPVSN